MSASRTEELSGSSILTNSSSTGLRGHSMSKTPEMIAAWQRHWPEYLLEGAELGLFMISACLFVVLLEYPASAVHQAIPDPFLRRVLIGIAMGLTAIGLIYSPLGQRSGAHFNPSVTLTFFRLGKIELWDTVFYIVFQFIGGLVGVLLSAVVLKEMIAHPAVQYAVTVPGMSGIAAAFLAEVGISFLQMSLVLGASNRPNLARFTGLFCGAMVAIYISLEAPFSGMSMNPARTFASALPAQVWTALWLYFTAPPLGMLLAAELYVRQRGLHQVFCAKLHHHNDKRCIFHCNYPPYPLTPILGGSMSHTKHYDVIIIGSGAGGGTLAYKLAPSGKRILLLERGPYVPREKENWDSHAVNVEARYHIKEPWFDKDGEEFHAGAHYYVGGNTKFYGAALIRLRKEDFGEVRHYDGISPAWPIHYEDLESYYTQAEHLYQVHGLRGTDPTESPASAPYLHPPLSHEPRIQQLIDDMTQLGHQPFPMPVGIMLDEKNPRKSRCIRCDTCDGFPCLVYAKADAQVICVDPALEHPNVTLLTDAYVERLETSPSGREVTKVHVERNGEKEIYSANIVVSSCGAINSAALLLHSANETHPSGLANSSDQVGRNYMCHVNSMFLAVSLDRNPTRFNKTFGLNDFYYGAKDWQYPMGHISMIGNIDANILRLGAPRIVPGMTLEIMANHTLPFWVTTEDLPNPDNRVTLTEHGGIRLSYTPNNEEAHKRLQAKLKDMLKTIGCHDHLVPLQAYIPGRIPLAGVAHQNGTIRFGHDSKTSALDANCKAHDLDNLYVVDGSFFPSSGAVNPALTIMANALRVGDHLLERLG